MMAHYYETHPLAKYGLWRSRIVIALTWAWSLRLTHNYFRREKWEWGSREDWRFTDMRGQYGKHWWWVSFFAVYVSQQVKIPLLCLWICVEFVFRYVFDESPSQGNYGTVMMN